MGTIRLLYRNKMLNRLFRVVGTIVFILAIAGFPMAQVPNVAQAAPLGWRDDFKGNTLGPSWFWVNEDPSMWSLTKRPGFLRIYTASGPTGSQNLLLRPVGPGDFAIQTHMFFHPRNNFQIAGLVIYQDDGNFLQLGRAYCDVPDICVGNGIYFDNIVDGVITGINYSTPTVSLDEAYLRLVYQDQVVAAFYSADDANWQMIGTHEVAAGFVANEVGLTSAQNIDPGVRAVPADFDYFASGPPMQPAVSWDGAAVLKPTVLKDAGGYKMWYDGVGFDGNTQIGLAISRDDQAWSKFVGNPILDGDPDAWDASGEHAPFVMKDGSTYKMWYEGFNGSLRQLGYATSPDGIHWTKYAGNPVLQAGPEGYDQWVAGHGTVLHEDGQYKLWYHAIGDQGIIIAYATSPDGINWTKEGPALIGAPGEWDEMLWGPSVLKVDGTYMMWYAASSSLYPPSIGVATSADGANWTRPVEGPVITDAENFDSIGDPTVILDRGVFKMWYGNFTDGKIYYADSPNGYQWTHPVPALLPGIGEKPIRTSPFVGFWQATDLDGSDMGLIIAGPYTGPFQITWTDNYIQFCDGGPGILSGTGWLNESDANLLEADVHLVCFTSGATLDFHVTFRYHPNVDTLSIRWDFGQVTIWHRSGKPQAPPPALNLRVNYGHDWVESFYEAGHSAWVTVTDSEGGVKAISDPVTEPKDYWGGEAGFQTLDSTWYDAGGNPMENPPDIQPDDWVFGWIDNGASANVQIGDISGTVDLENDSIEGTILALWFTDRVQVECLDWGSGEETPYPNKDGGYIKTDGSESYACSWEGEWDIQPGQNVGVGYFGPDGNWVANAFYAMPPPSILAQITEDWFLGQYFTPNSELSYQVYEALGGNQLLSGTMQADDRGTAGIWVGEYVDLVPGNYLVVSDGTTMKDLTLEAITFDVFDTTRGYLQGTAPMPENRQVWVGIGWQENAWTMDVMSDPKGNWSADFGEPVPEDYLWVAAQVFDVDGDISEVRPSPRSLMAGNFSLAWSQINPEDVIYLSWNGSGNLTKSWASPSCEGDSEFFGDGWVSENEGTPDFFFASLVGWGTTGSWNRIDPLIDIGSSSSGCPGSAGIPIHTTYQFPEGKPNLIEVERTFEFGETPYAHDIRPFIPRLYPIVGFSQVIHPNADGTGLVTNVTCGYGCLADEWDGTWFAIHNPGNGLGMIVHRAPSEYSAGLWLDDDSGSYTNASSILLLKPGSGFTGKVTETEHLCFYDSSIWTPSLTLPSECQP
jgi:predicted GH43/DUF377 family glycosyl hydrolase/regulation of enolase protein 1 (concanavalin A-like superfamily)